MYVRMDRWITRQSYQKGSSFAAKNYTQILLKSQPSLWLVHLIDPLPSSKGGQTFKYLAFSASTVRDGFCLIRTLERGDSYIP